MKNILIAQIGTGDYRKTDYLNGDVMGEIIRNVGESSLKISNTEENITTGYTFEATMRDIYIRERIVMDHVLLIGTNESHYASLLHYYWSKAENRKNSLQDNLDEFKKAILYDDIKVSRISPSNPNVFVGLKGDAKYTDSLVKEMEPHLRKYFKKATEEYFKKTENQYHPKFQIVITDYGIDKQELQHNFDKLKSVIYEILSEGMGASDTAESDAEADKEKVHIYFDISNGFRSIPMYIYTIFNYLLRVRDEKFELHMYYGMADGKKNNNSLAPIVNLQNVNDMMRWINAANEFHNYGSVRELVKLLARAEKTKRIFEKFDYASNANNLKMLKESIECIIKLADIRTNEEIVGEYRAEAETDDFIREIQELVQNKDDAIPSYALELIQKIGKEFREEFDQNNCLEELEYEGYSYSYLTLKLANWYLSQGRTGNAAVALQEGIITFIMESWGEETVEYLRLSGRSNKSKYDQNRVDWLFKYQFREPIKKILLADHLDWKTKLENESKDKDTLIFEEKMSVVKNNIRNTGAHILNIDIDESTIQKSNEKLSGLISVMIELIQKRDDDRTEVKNMRSTLYSKLINMITLLKVLKVYEKAIAGNGRTVNRTTLEEIHEIAMDYSLREQIDALSSDLCFLETCQIQEEMSAEEKSEKMTLFKDGIETADRKILASFMKKQSPGSFAGNTVIDDNKCKKLLIETGDKNKETVLKRLLMWMKNNAETYVYDELIREKYVLAMYDVRGKQAFIFRTNRIKEIMGASWIISDVFKDYLYPAAIEYREKIRGTTGNEQVIEVDGMADTEHNTEAQGESMECGDAIYKYSEDEPFDVKEFHKRMNGSQYLGEVVYDGGGNFLVLYRSETVFKEINKIFTRNVLENIGTLNILCTCVPVSDPDLSNYKEDSRRLYAKHALLESSESVVRPVSGIPFVQVDPMTSMPLSCLTTVQIPENRNNIEIKRKVSVESAAKYAKYKEIKDIKKAEGRAEEDGEKILDKIVKEKGKDSLLAVIFIDGNNMGARVQNCFRNPDDPTKEIAEDYGVRVSALRKFSKEIQEVFVTSRKKAIEDWLDKQYEERNKKSKNKTKRMIVYAGDEMSFIVRAEDALGTVNAYFKSLFPGNSACAGIAIFHSHAPYAEAYRIAEECCETGKKYMKDQNPPETETCYVDFQFCHSDMGRDLKTIRIHENKDLVSRPWYIKDNRIQKWSAEQRNADFLNQAIDDTESANQWVSDKIEQEKTGMAENDQQIEENAAEEKASEVQKTEKAVEEAASEVQKTADEELESQNLETQADEKCFVPPVMKDIEKAAEHLRAIKSRGNIKTLMQAAERSMVEFNMEMDRIYAHQKKEVQEIIKETFGKPEERMEYMQNDLNRRRLIHDIALTYDLWFQKEMVK